MRLDFDPRTHRLFAQHARNVPMIRQASAADPAIAALVKRYAEAVAPIADRVIGRLTATAKKSDQESESQAADLIADSMLAATKSDAQLRAWSTRPASGSTCRAATSATRTPSR